MSVIPISRDIRAQLKRSSRRRSIGIKVHDGRVTVSAPIQVSIQEIQSFVKQKTVWIERHLQRQQTQKATYKERSLLPGDTLLYLGNPINLVCDSDNEHGVIIAFDEKKQNLSIADAGYQLTLAGRKSLIASWYMNRACTHFEQRVLMLSKAMKLYPKGVKLRYYKSRWGSCNRHGQLQFNWSLMMAPPDVVDYVIVHELAHLQHFNHSPAFWALVESIVPNHKQHRAWLKNQTDLLW